MTNNQITDRESPMFLTPIRDLSVEELEMVVGGAPFSEVDFKPCGTSDQGWCED